MNIILIYEYNINNMNMDLGSSLACCNLLPILIMDLGLIPIECRLLPILIIIKKDKNNNEKI